MDIERQPCFLADEADNCRAEGNVIDKMPIHDVAMDPIRPGLLHPIELHRQAVKNQRQESTVQR